MENLLSIIPGLQFQRTEKKEPQLDPKVFGEKVGVVASLFGCWHKNLSRPFSKGKTSYRTCLECGSRKPFEPANLKTLDGFYRAPIVRRFDS